MASTEKLPSGRYRGVYRDAAGRKKYTPAQDRKQDAREDAVEAEAKAKRRAAADTGTLSARTTFAQWWETFTSTRHLESDTGLTEAQNARAYLLPKWADVPLNRITQQDVQRWVIALERGSAPVEMRSPRYSRRPLSASYVRRVYSTFRVAITAALEAGVLDASPCAGVKLPTVGKRPKTYMATDEADALAEEMRGEFADAVEFALETGLRPGELTGLHAHRYDRRRKVLVITETFVFRAKKIRGWPKDGDAREVPLSTRACEILDRRLQGRDLRESCGVPHMRGERCTHPLVFLTRLGRPLSRDVLNYHLRQAAKTAKVDAKSGYTLRRGFATRLAEGGLDAFQLAEVMGHSDIRQSQEYVQTTKTARARVLAALGDRAPLAAVEDAERGTRGTDRGTDRDNQPPAEAPKRKGGQVG